jgi:hypothetical protein
MRLAQVFSNLLNNASRRTLDGGDVWLATELTDDDVVVTVSDNGIGISPERCRRSSICSSSMRTPTIPVSASAWPSRRSWSGRTEARSRRAARERVKAAASSSGCRSQRRAATSSPS